MTEDHTIVALDEWIEARKALLVREEEFTRRRDEMSQQRRGLPWEFVDKEYVFEGWYGKQTLADLFDGRSQLIVYHFMFAPHASSTASPGAVRLTVSAARRAFDLESKLSPLLAIFSPFTDFSRQRYLPAVSA